MAVLVNFKICDNAKECGGISVCPTGALSWNEEKKSIEIDNDKCISCGQCEKECPIGAIMISKSREEYEKNKKEIAEDTRTIKDLFVDRYGASPLSDFFKIDGSDIEAKKNLKRITLIELYNDDSIQCLLKSIPIKKITENFEDIMFYKVYADDETLKKYNINVLPSLLVFKDGKLNNIVEGYYCEEEYSTLISKIDL